MRDATISVVISTCSRVRCLPAPVPSIHEQTYPCDEIVIVYDRSRDDTRPHSSLGGD
jgi:GT2 family glycosyltransferase